MSWKTTSETTGMEITFTIGAHVTNETLAVLVSGAPLCEGVNYFEFVPSVTPGTYHKLMHLLRCLQYRTWQTIVTLVSDTTTSNTGVLKELDMGQYIKWGGRQLWDRQWWCNTKQMINSFSWHFSTHHIGWQPPVLLMYQIMTRVHHMT